MFSVVWVLGALVVGFCLGVVSLFFAVDRDSTAAHQSKDDGSALDQRTLLDTFSEPLCIIEDVSVPDTNQAFRSLFGVEDETGQSVHELLADFPAVRDAMLADEETLVEFESDGKYRTMQVRSFAVASETHPQRQLCLLYDVTDQQARKHELETQNEQLEQFATRITHDLRNPLDVAMGRASVIGEMLDDPELSGHIEEVQHAHDRMRTLIEDVLTLSRKGSTIGRMEPVSLDDSATDSWRNVYTSAATLDVETDLDVLADKDRLKQILENLFRNAVEHGGEDVTVSVGAIDGGFYVADTGSGIPPEDRELLLKPGYDISGDSEFGLAIVTTIVEGHDWAVTVSESDAGGARFEFTGVQLVDQSAEAS